MFIKWVKLTGQLPLLISVFMVIIDDMKRSPTDSGENKEMHMICVCGREQELHED
jgi:hypothetical protein